MNRWLKYLFMVMTFGPVLLWLGTFLALIVLGSGFGCRIDEAGTYPCEVFGRDMGEFAALMGLLAAWGPLIFGPVVAVSAAAWGLTWGLGRLFRALRENR